MAARYWVGGGSSSSWTATGPTNWGTASNTQNNASVPVASSDVFFDGVGTGASNCSISANTTVHCRSLNATGYSNTLSTTFPNSALSIGDATAGSGNIALKLSATMTLTLNGDDTLSFISSSATVQTVDAAGKSLNFQSLSFSTAGSWQLSANLSCLTCTISGGTFDTNGFTVNTGGSYFSSANCTLTLGASSVTCHDWYATSSVIFSAGTSTINLATTGQIFQGGDLIYNNVVMSGSSVRYITGSNTFANLTRTGNATRTCELNIIGNQTITGTLTVNGSSTTNRLLLSGDFGNGTTLTAAALTASNLDIKDITGAGAASWNLSAITGKSGDCGGNSGITFTTGQTQYWLHNSTTSLNWTTASRWFLATNGGGGAGRIPLPQDDAILDVNSFPTSGKTLVMDVPRAGKNINWTGVLNSPNIATSGTAPNVTIYGSFTLASTSNFSTSLGTIVMEGRGGSFTITPSSTGLGGNSLTIQALASTITLQGHLDSVADFGVLAGTFNANNYNVVMADGLFFNDVGFARTLQMGSGTWTLSGFWQADSSNGTLTADTSTISMCVAAGPDISFYGAGLTYYDLYLRDSDTPSPTANFLILNDGNVFHSILGDILLSTGLTIVIENSTTQTVSVFNYTSTADFGGFLASDAGGTPLPIATASGTSTLDWLTITDSVISGNGKYYAGTHSTDGGGNDGWIFAGAHHRSAGSASAGAQSY